LAELGAVVIDSDALAREVVQPGTPGLAEIVEVFGPGVLGPDGALDRPALARLVFGDAGQRRRLEAIVHPLVRARAAEIALAAPQDAIVVNDVPLLIEAGLPRLYQVVIVVLADEEVRIARLARDRGMSEADALARMATQANDQQRRAVADIVIVNNGDMESLRSQVDAAWAALRARV
jgi:dephospho-CoA kinase